VTVSQRSPHNPRYQKNAKLGSTRKSAASAKPKRSAGGPGSSSGSKKQKPKKKRRLIETVTTPEIKRQRKRWWIFMGIALLAAVALVLEPVGGNVTLRSIAMGVWLAGFGTAIYIDWFVVRKLRKAEIERRKKSEKKG